ncbi:MAG: SCP2 sterol-binding domain-containing protein [Candidatus Scalindua sp.]|nr:SCP2 sterol-binding domain-containing protein [Candidatus Scalindua sp.]
MKSKACQGKEIEQKDAEKQPEITAQTTHTEYFEKMMYNRVNNSPIPKIRSLNAIIQFDIVGDNPGNWIVIIEKGVVKRIVSGFVEKGSAEGDCLQENVNNDTVSSGTIRKSKCTFQLDGNTFMSIVRREITPQHALFQRKVHIRGDMLLALKMNVLVNYL